MSSLLEELKRRKVVRVAGVYAVVAWLLIQVADNLVPALQLPDWANSLVVFLLIMGFPIALLLAWAYEIVPAGERQNGDLHAAIAPSNISGQGINNKLLYAMFALLLLAVTFQIGDRLFFNASPANTSAVITTASGSNQVARSLIPLGPTVPHADTGLRSSLAISPGGERIAFILSNGETTQLYVRELDALEPQLVATINNMFRFQFSLDGESLFYFDRQSSDGMTISRVALNSGLAVPAGGSTSAYGFTWLDDGTLISHSNQFRNLLIENESGRQPLNIIPVLQDGAFPSLPHALPGQRAILLTLSEYGLIGETGAIALFDLDSGITRTLINDAYHASYSDSGHILFMRGTDLWAVPFDLDSRVLTGNEVLLVQGIEGNAEIGYAIYSISRSGDLIYLSGSNREYGGAPARSLAWVDRTGIETVLDLVPQRYVSPQLSPDGSSAVFSILDGLQRDVWRYDFDRDTLSRITYSRTADNPVWDPSGSRILYRDFSSIEAISARGLGEAETIIDNASLGFISGRDFSSSTSMISPDGAKLFLIAFNADTDIYTIDLAPEHAVAPVLNGSPANEQAGKVSPDGSLLAYVSDETGRNEVYLRPYPDVNSNKWQVSSNGGLDPQWARDTGELFFRRQVAEAMETYAVTIVPGAEVGVERPRLLFTGQYFDGVEGTNMYDVSADGQRFLVLKDAALTQRSAVDTNIVLVQNFGEELQRRVPTSN